MTTLPNSCFGKAKCFDWWGLSGTEAIIGLEEPNVGALLLTEIGVEVEVVAEKLQVASQSLALKKSNTVRALIFAGLNFRGFRGLEAIRESLDQRKV